MPANPELIPGIPDFAGEIVGACPLCGAHAFHVRARREGQPCEVFRCDRCHEKWTAGQGPSVFHAAAIPTDDDF